MPDYQTVRIPELPPYGTYGPPATADRLPIWLSAFNKTCWVDIAALAQIFGGGGGSFSPVVIGADVIHDITAAENGGSVVNIGSLAGKHFFLEIDGRAFTTDEYEILNSGGFHITIPGYQLRGDGTPDNSQRCVLTVFELQAGGGGGGSSSGGGGGAFLIGEVVVSANQTLTTDDLQKLIQLRGGSTNLTLTLLSCADCPAGTVILIESVIGSGTHAIQTQGDQLIYMNNTAYGTVYIKAGETCMLYAKADGFYVLGDFAEVYRNVGKIEESFKVAPNTLNLDGSTPLRSDEPRLWQWVQTLENSLVDDVTRAFAPGDSLRGCFTRGDGTSNFRLPNLTGMYTKGLAADDRIYNYAGGYMPDRLKSHTHNVQIPSRDFNNQGTSGPDLTGADGGAAAGSTRSFTTDAPAGSGTTNEVKNIGVYKTIRC